MDTIVVLRAGAHGRSQMYFRFALFRILVRAGQSVQRNFFGKIARKVENLNESRIFGGNRAETCCGRLGGSTEVWEIAGAAVALRAGVHGRVTFDFVLRCVRMWTVRIFRRNCAKSRKIQ